MNKRRYHVRAENSKSGKTVEGEITCWKIGNVVSVFARHNWIVTEYHEIYERIKG